MSDPVPTPTDPLLETLTIPTPPQIVSQPHIIESTTNETTINYPNQEQTTTRTHGFKHHSLPTTMPDDPKLELPPDIWDQMSDKQRRHYFSRRNKK